MALAEYWYNTSWHSALGTSPFVVLYGHEPRHWGIEAASATPASDLHTWLSERQDMTALIKLHLLRARDRMKHQADKNRSERILAVGDKVFIKLQPYVQSSVAKRASHKLSFKYFGPFTITDRIGQVAYRVALPENSTVHLVFHVSLLRKALKSTDQVSTILPTDTNLFVAPVQIMDRRRKAKANRMVDQVLIRWSGGTLPDSWEGIDELQSRFPGAAAWGQAATEGEGGVSNLPSDGLEAHQEPNPTGDAPGRRAPGQGNLTRVSLGTAGRPEAISDV